MHPIPTSQDQLRQWLEAPEGSRFEFKEARNRYDFEKLVDYCVALANEGGGKIILGATDPLCRSWNSYSLPSPSVCSVNSKTSTRSPWKEHDAGRGGNLPIKHNILQTELKKCALAPVL